VLILLCFLFEAILNCVEQRQLVLLLSLYQSRVFLYKIVFRRILSKTESCPNFSWKVSFTLVNVISVSFQMEIGADFSLETGLEWARGDR
jgi:hypothetical protein